MSITRANRRVASASPSGVRLPAPTSQQHRHPTSVQATDSASPILVSGQSSREHIGRRTKDAAREARDRAKVRALVDLVGRRQVTFTIEDLRRAMAQHPEHALEAPQALSRHVHALPDDLVADLGPRLFPYAHPTVPSNGATGGSSMAVDIAPRDMAPTQASDHTDMPRRPPSSRAPHEFTLPHNLPHLAQHGVAPTRTDAERLYLALWVAYLALGRQPVPTVAVTAVRRQVPELASRAVGQTNTQLRGLASRRQPLALQHVTAQPSPRGNGVSVCWEPIGEQPPAATIEAWLAQVRASVLPEAQPAPKPVEPEPQISSTHSARARAFVVPTAHASWSAVVRELVEITINHYVSKEWPYGRPVTVKEIEAVCTEHARGRTLLEALRASGRALHVVLGDAVKPVIGARRRRAAPQLVRCRGDRGELTRYDAPGLAGTVERTLFPRFQSAMSTLHPLTVERTVMEINQAEQLLRQAQRPVELLAARVRLAVAHRELDHSTALADDLLHGGRLSEPCAARLRERLAEVERRRGRLAGSSRVAVAFAEAALADAAVVAYAAGANETLPTIDAVMNAEPPVLTSQDLAAYFPPEAWRGRTATAFAANFTTLRRRQNPHFVSTGDPDPIRAAKTVVDRVEALGTIMERSGSQLSGFVTPARRLLGNGLRDPRLLTPLLATDDRREWRLGMAALALLGAPEAAAAARSVLRAHAPDPQDVESALFALLLLRTLDPTDIPDALGRGPCGAVVRRARRAVRTGYWLMGG